MVENHVESGTEVAPRHVEPSLAWFWSMHTDCNGMIFCSIDRWPRYSIKGFYLILRPCVQSPDEAREKVASDFLPKEWWMVDPSS